MKAEKMPMEQPDVLITLSWKEAEILQVVVGGIHGASPNRDCTDKLHDVLCDLGITEVSNVAFSGTFQFT